MPADSNAPIDFLWEIILFKRLGRFRLCGELNSDVINLHRAWELGKLNLEELVLGGCYKR